MPAPFPYTFGRRFRLESEENEIQGTPLEAGLAAPVTHEEKVQDEYAQKETDLKNKILTDSVNEARAKYDPRTDLQGFVKEVSRLFIEKKLDAFPTLCEITRVQNMMERQKMEKQGNRGRFTGKSGFSQSGDSYFKWEIPRELYLFMVNLVYWDFWGPDNKKIADGFMRRICKGEDPMSILMTVKAIYGSNSQNEIITA